MCFPRSFIATFRQTFPSHDALRVLQENEEKNESDLKSTIKNAITQGNWTVLELLDVNQTTGTLIFTGAGREGGDPYFHSLYRVHKDGSDLRLLTPENQHHRILLSKNAEYFLDRVSTPNTPESSYIRSTKTSSSLLVEKWISANLKKRVGRHRYLLW